MIGVCGVCGVRCSRRTPTPPMREGGGQRSAVGEDRLALPGYPNVVISLPTRIIGTGPLGSFHVWWPTERGRRDPYSQICRPFCNLPRTARTVERGGERRRTVKKV